MYYIDLWLTPERLVEFLRTARFVARNTNRGKIEENSTVNTTVVLKVLSSSFYDMHLGYYYVLCMYVNRNKGDFQRVK
jgi:hypothetical protein